MGNRNNRLRRAIYASTSEKKIFNDDKSDIDDPLLDVDESSAQSTDASSGTAADAKTIVSDGQTPDVDTATTDSAKQKTDKAARTRTTESRSRKQDNEKRILSRLLVRHVDHPAEDGGTGPVCSCGAILVKTGEDIITKIEFIPGHFVEHTYHQPFFRCPHCAGDPEQASLLPKALENEILPKALRNPSLGKCSPMPASNGTTSASICCIQGLA